MGVRGGEGVDGGCCVEIEAPEILALYAGKSLLACRMNKQTKKQKLKKKKDKRKSEKGDLNNRMSLIFYLRSKIP